MKVLNTVEIPAKSVVRGDYLIYDGTPLRVRRIQRNAGWGYTRFVLRRDWRAKATDEHLSPSKNVTVAQLIEYNLLEVSGRVVLGTLFAPWLVLSFFAVLCLYALTYPMDWMRHRTTPGEHISSAREAYWTPLRAFAAYGNCFRRRCVMRYTNGEVYEL